MVALIHARTMSRIPCIRPFRQPKIPRSKARYECLALLTSVLIFVSTACSTLPSDPEGTLARVAREHLIRIGIAENPPWVICTAGEPTGVEVQLAHEFAASLHATAKWYRGSEQDEMESLERFQLDLVIAGLHATTPWTKKVGLTQAYFKEQVEVGVPRGMGIPRTLKGMKISVRDGNATAAYLIKEGATPVLVPDISQAVGAAAAPSWRLKRLGFSLTPFVLFEDKHVLAVPPGENGWLKCLGEFLQAHASTVEPLLSGSEGEK